MLDSLAQEKNLPNACVVLNGLDMLKRKYDYYYGYGHYGSDGSSSHYGDKNDCSIKKYVCFNCRFCHCTYLYKKASPRRGGFTM